MIASFLYFLHFYLLENSNLSSKIATKSIFRHPDCGIGSGFRALTNQINEWYLLHAFDQSAPFAPPVGFTSQRESGRRVGAHLAEREKISWIFFSRKKWKKSKKSEKWTTRQWVRTISNRAMIGIGTRGCDLSRFSAKLMKFCLFFQTHFYEAPENCLKNLMT